jgi:hypothetical protein
VVVWAERERAADAARELAARYPDARVLALRVASEGALERE